LTKFVEQCPANRQGCSTVDEKGYQEAFTEAGEKIVAQEQTEDQEVACLNFRWTYFPRIPPSRFKNQALCRTHQDNKGYGCTFASLKHFVIVIELKTFVIESGGMGIWAIGRKSANPVLHRIGLIKLAAKNVYLEEMI
jgi:hypothetical protein